MSYKSWLYPRTGESIDHGWIIAKKTSIQELRYFRYCQLKETVEQTVTTSGLRFLNGLRVTLTTVEYPVKEKHVVSIYIGYALESLTGDVDLLIVDIVFCL